MANFIPAGANAVETSDLRTSGDVTVTDTQPGTVNNGEFLTNSGGNLTGGIIETEPNIPNWEETTPSPYTDFNGNQSIYISNIDNSYDYLRVFFKGSAVGTGGSGEVDLEINSTDFSIDHYGGGSGFADNTPIGFIGQPSDKPFVAMMDFAANGDVRGVIPIAEKNVSVGGTDNIDSIRFRTDRDTDFTVRIFGLNL